MERKVVVIHITVVAYDGINNRLKAPVPSAEAISIVDDSLSNDAKKEGMLTKKVTRRFLTYTLEAQDWGAELILNACSSVGEGMDAIRPLLKIPYLKTDESVVRSAVEKSEKITVYGTTKTTLESSARFTSHATEAEKEKTVVDPYLASDMFEALAVEKNQEKHNQILEALIQDMGKQYDALVLVQISTSVLIPCLADVTELILGSMGPGVEAVARALKGL